MKSFGELSASFIVYLFKLSAKAPLVSAKAPWAHAMMWKYLQGMSSSILRYVGAATLYKALMPGIN